MHLWSCKQNYITNFVSWMADGTKSQSYSVVESVNEDEPLGLVNRQFVKIKIKYIT